MNYGIVDLLTHLGFGWIANLIAPILCNYPKQYDASAYPIPAQLRPWCPSFVWRWQHASKNERRAYRLELKAICTPSQWRHIVKNYEWLTEDAV